MKAIKFLFLVFSGILAYAQANTNQTDQVGVNTDKPDASAVLEIFSDDKGVLMPRLSEDRIKNIQNPKAGLMLFNVSKDCMVARENKGWSDCRRESNYCISMSANGIHYPIYQIFN